MLSGLDWGNKRLVKYTSLETSGLKIIQENNNNKKKATINWSEIHIVILLFSVGCLGYLISILYYKQTYVPSHDIGFLLLLLSPGPCSSDNISV